MKKINHLKSMFLLLLVIIISMKMPSMVNASNIIKQNIYLKAGWNAIFLEVNPVNSCPDIIFKDTPVNLVLTYFPKNSSVQFIKSPDEIQWKQEGWYRWLPPEREESILNNLYNLNDNQAYIIFSTQDYHLELTGVSTIRKHRWQPDTFNLVGFYVDPVAPPTFAQYFSNSTAHADFNFYYLKDNNWVKIDNPGAVNIQSGKAYWIYCNGSSNYAGPMEIDLPGTFDYLNFIDATAELEMTIKNNSQDPLSLTIESVDNAPDDDMVPLSIVSYNLDKTKIYEPFVSFTPSMPLEAGQTLLFRLAVRRNEITKNDVSHRLKIMDDLGNRFFIPVFAEKIVD